MKFILINFFCFVLSNSFAFHLRDISLKSLKCNTIFSYSYDFSNFSKIIKFTTNNNSPEISKITISNPNDFPYFGCFMGKGALNKMTELFRKRKYSQKIDLKLDSKENLQFFIFHLNSPGQVHLIDIKTEWDYEFTRNSNILSIFTIIFASRSNETGKIIISWFPKVTKVFAPKGTKSFLDYRLSKAIELFPILNEQFESLREFIMRKIPFSYSKKERMKRPISDDTFIENAPLIKADVQFKALKLEQNQIIYVWTDETAHFWLSKTGETLYVVDAGLQILANGIDFVISDSEKITCIRIFITLFLLDHVQALAGFIARSATAQRKIFLYVHEDNKIELAGWLAENLHHIQKYKVFLEFLGSSNKNIENDGSVSVVGFACNYCGKVKHFFANFSFIIMEKGKCVKLFASDSNSNPEFSFSGNDNSNDLKEYLEFIFSSIELLDGSQKCAHVFLDYGHFNGKKENFDLAKYEYFTKDKRESLKIQIFYEHNKFEGGYNLAKAHLNHHFKQGSTVDECK